MSDKKREWLRIMVITQPFKIEKGKVTIAGLELGLNREFLFEELKDKDLFETIWKYMGEQIYHAFRSKYWQMKEGNKIEE